MNPPAGLHADAHFTDGAFAGANGSNGWVSAVVDPGCSGGNNKTDTGGLIEATTDGGATWTVQYQGPDAVLSLAFSGTQDGWAIAVPADTLPACNTPPVPGQGSDGVLLGTTDGGRSWRVIDPNASGIVALYFSSAQDGWAGQANCSGTTCSGALLHTTDGGGSWTVVPSADPAPGGTTQGVPVIALAGLNSTVWALEAGPSGPRTGVSRIMASTGGGSWAAVGSLPLAAVAQSAGATGTLTFTSSTQGWATIAARNSCTMASCGVNGVYQTTDGGHIWTEVAKHGCNVPAPYVAAADGQVLAARGINGAACPGPVTTFLAPINGGGTWSTVGYWSDLRAAALLAVPGNGGGAVFWAVTSQALLRSTDGGTKWSQILPPPVPSANIAFLSATDGWGVGTVSDPGAILKTTDGGRNWAVVASVPDAALSAITFSDANHGWVVGSIPAWESGTGSGLLWGTTDGGSSWKPLEPSGSVKSCVSTGTCSPPASPIPVSAVVHFTSALDGTLIGRGAQFNCDVTTCQKHDVLTTADGGATWSATATVPMASQLAVADIAGDGTVWGLWNSGANCGQMLGRGTLATSTWTAVGCLTGYTGGPTLQFISPTDGFAVLLQVLQPPAPGHPAVTRPVLLRTTDAGSHWTQTPLSVASTDFFGNHVFFLSATQGWMLNGGVLWATDDGGAHWTGLAD